MGDVTHGKNEHLEELADLFLARSDDNDWDTTPESVYAISVAPSDIAGIEPDICAEVGDGNARARNPKLRERRALTRHMRDKDHWTTAEDLPLLGVNDGPRKTCSKCKRSKGLSLFSPKADAKDGLHPWCKKCRKDAVSQKREKARSEALTADSDSRRDRHSAGPYFFAERPCGQVQTTKL